MRAARSRVPRSLLAVAVLLCACERAADDAMVEPALPLTELAITTVIGEEGGPAQFARVMDVATDGRGRIYVLDGLDAEVRVFTAEGAHRFTFGGQGAGPAELRAPCCMAFAPDGTLWVRDNGNARYVGWRVSGDSAIAVATQRMVHADANRYAPVIFDDAGRVIDIGSRTGEDGNAITHHFFVSAAGTIDRAQPLPSPPADSLGMRTIRRSMPDGTTMTLYTTPPYAPAELRAHGPGGEFAHGISSSYRIEWRDAHGNLIRTIRGSVSELPRVSAAEATRADSQMTRIARRLNVPRAELELSTPERKQPLHTIYFDADGRLWVELSVAEGAARRAHVYDRSGRRLFDLSWPPHVALRGSGLGTAALWGVARDSLDVQSVVRLQPPS